MLLAASPNAFSDEVYKGQVQKVSDGDTITVLTTDYERIKVRFYGIDAPEKSQAFGPQAAAALAAMVEGKEVEIEVIDIDRYSRLVGLVRVDGRLVNQSMVASGHAWVYDQYCRLDAVCASLHKAQSEAQAVRKGLWSDPSPTAPWQFRRGDRSETAPGTSKPSASDSSASSEKISGQRHGNRNSKVVHNSSCVHFNCKNCTIIFSNRQQAIDAGFKACSLCGG
jgi:endonuclease YncB( thermonuclease family)